MGVSGVQKAQPARALTGETRLLARWRALPHTATRDALARLLSRFGDHARGWLALSATGALLDHKRARRWLIGGLAIAATEQTSRQVKDVVRRERPELDGLPPLTTVTSRYSFPSSHTATAVAAVRVLDGLLPRRVLVGWAALTALSRPYLGVHYPSDVLGGALLGYWAGRVLDVSRDGLIRGSRSIR